MWAEQNSDRWYILSALHGLLLPDQIVEPYECTLNTMQSSERVTWGKKTTEQIKALVPVGRVVVLAGSKYRDNLDLSGYSVAVPMQGLGIGQQLAWLNGQLLQQSSLF